MKIKHLALISTLFILPAASNAQKPDVDFMMDLIKQNSNFAEGAKCLNIKESKMEEVMRKALTHCFSQHQVTQDKAMDACIQTQVSKFSGKSQEQIAACETEESKLERKLSDIDSQIEALELELQELNYKEGLSLTDERRMDTIEQRLDKLMVQQDMLSDKLADRTMGSAERELNALFEEIGDGAATPAQKKKLKELRARYVQENQY